MKIIKPHFEVYENLPDPAYTEWILFKLDKIGRTCYKSEASGDQESAGRFVRKLIERGHEAMLEHVSISVKFVVDRGVSHELVRHRMASFAQESTRYCVAGNTLLTYGNPHIHMTVAELYDNMVNSKNGAWKRITIRQYDEETGELCFARPLNVFNNGIRKCIRIRTDLGYEITCTPDHHILTPHGYKNACDIDEGDQILVNGTDQLYKNKDWLYHQSIELNKTFVEIANEYGFNVSTVKKWARKHGISKKGTGYFHIGHTPWNKGITDERQAAALRTYHHCGRRKEGFMKDDAVKYQRHKGNVCEICGADEIDTGSPLQVHHKDEDRTNNNPENLITLCGSCHQKVHSKNLLTAYADSVVEITDAGEQMVYDVEMKSDNHNYVANGVIVHNCNYSKDKFGNELTFIEPCFWSDVYPSNTWHLMNQWKLDMEMFEEKYMQMINQGAKPEEARVVLPNSLKTEIWMTCNLREWRHVLKLRAAGTTGKPHPQMAEVMIQLLKYMKQYLPDVFFDIEVPHD